MENGNGKRVPTITIWQLIPLLGTTLIPGAAAWFRQEGMVERQNEVLKEVREELRAIRGDMRLDHDELVRLKEWQKQVGK